jgi:hypothetical protein
LWRKTLNIVELLFAGAGFAIIAAWGIYQLGWTNNGGAVDQNYRSLMSVSEIEELKDAKLTQEQIDAEWQRLANAEVKNEDYESGNRRSFLKIAASFIGLLIVSGIAFAAIRMLNRMPDNAPKVEQSVNASAKDTIIKTTEDFPVDSVAEASVEFDNLPLEQMLAEIASYYKAEVTFRNESARMLRFYFVWRRSEGLEQVVEDLNHFESLHVTLKDNLIIVE